MATNTLGSTSSARQQLDDLDALLQKMLTLPLPGSDEPAPPPPVLPTLSHHPAEEGEVRIPGPRSLPPLPPLPPPIQAGHPPAPPSNPVKASLPPSRPEGSFLLTSQPAASGPTVLPPLPPAPPTPPTPLSVPTPRPPLPVQSLPLLPPLPPVPPVPPVPVVPAASPAPPTISAPSIGSGLLPPPTESNPVRPILAPPAIPPGLLPTRPTPVETPPVAKNIQPTPEPVTEPVTERPPAEEWKVPLPSGVGTPPPKPSFLGAWESLPPPTHYPAPIRPPEPEPAPAPVRRWPTPSEAAPPSGPPLPFALGPIPPAPTPPTMVFGASPVEVPPQTQGEQVNRGSLTILPPSAPAPQSSPLPTFEPPSPPEATEASKMCRPSSPVLVPAPNIAEQPPLPLILYPLAGINALLVGLLMLLGPLGTLLTSGIGRNILGWSGILMMVTAVGIVAAEWFGIGMTW